ncbi:MAG: hypothetical protein J6333_06570 [Planctomycetes bacterium]|nr:hypothetical protein [Planctomycetota bacterium]
MPGKPAPETRPEDIPAQFPDIRKMLALSDVARDYEKGKIDKAALLARLRELEPDPAAVARVYGKMTGEEPPEG